MAADNVQDEAWNFYVREWQEKANGTQKKVTSGSYMTHAKPKKLNKLKSFKEQYFHVAWKRIEWFDAPGLKRARGGIDFKLIKDVVMPSSVAKLPEEVAFSFDIVHLEDKKKKPKTLTQTIVVVEESKRREAARFYRDVRQTWLAHPFTIRDKKIKCPGKPPKEPHSVPRPDVTPGVIDVEATHTRGGDTLIKQAVMLPSGNVMVAAEQEHGLQLWGKDKGRFTMGYAEAGAGDVADLCTELYVDEHVVAVAYTAGRVQVFQAGAELSQFIGFEFPDMADGETLQHIAMTSSPPLVFVTSTKRLVCYSVDQNSVVGTAELPGAPLSLTAATLDSGACAVVAMAGVDDVLLFDSASIAEGNPCVTLSGGAGSVGAAFVKATAMLVSGSASGSVAAWTGTGESVGSIDLEAGPILSIVASAETDHIAAVTQSKLFILTTPDLVIAEAVELDYPITTTPVFFHGANVVYDQGDAIAVTDDGHVFPFGAIAMGAPTESIFVSQGADILGVVGKDGRIRLVTRFASKVDRCSREFETKMVALGRWKEKTAQNLPQVKAYEAELAAYNARLEEFIQKTTVQL